MSKEIIAFIGRAGSGKDYQCQLLEKQGYVKRAFADALRDIAFTSLGITDTENYGWYKQNECIYVQHKCLSEKVIDNVTVDTYSKLTLRQFVERLATEGIRKYDPDFWANCLTKSLLDDMACGYTKFCISDLRFINEYRVLKRFAQDVKAELHIKLCDYHSDRYIENETHESAWLANKLIELGYEDGDAIIDSQLKLLENAF